MVEDGRSDRAQSPRKLMSLRSATLPRHRANPLSNQHPPSLPSPPFLDSSSPPHPLGLSYASDVSSLHPDTFTSSHPSSLTRSIPTILTSSSYHNIASSLSKSKTLLSHRHRPHSPPTQSPSPPPLAAPSPPPSPPTSSLFSSPPSPSIIPKNLKHISSAINRPSPSILNEPSGDSPLCSPGACEPNRPRQLQYTSEDLMTSEIVYEEIECMTSDSRGQVRQDIDRTVNRIPSERERGEKTEQESSDDDYKRFYESYMNTVNQSASATQRSALSAVEEEEEDAENKTTTGREEVRTGESNVVREGNNDQEEYPSDFDCVEESNVASEGNNDEQEEYLSDFDCEDENEGKDDSNRQYSYQEEYQIEEGRRIQGGGVTSVPPPCDSHSHGLPAVSSLHKITKTRSPKILEEEITYESHTQQQLCLGGAGRGGREGERSGRQEEWNWIEGGTGEEERCVRDGSDGKMSDEPSVCRGADDVHTDIDTDTNIQTCTENHRDMNIDDNIHTDRRTDTQRSARRDSCSYAMLGTQEDIRTDTSRHTDDPTESPRDTEDTGGHTDTHTDTDSCTHTGTHTDRNIDNHTDTLTDMHTGCTERERVTCVEAVSMKSGSMKSGEKRVRKDVYENLTAAFKRSTADVVQVTDTTLSNNNIEQQHHTISSIHITNNCSSSSLSHISRDHITQSMSESSHDDDDDDVDIECSKLTHTSSNTHSNNKHRWLDVDISMYPPPSIHTSSSLPSSSTPTSSLVASSHATSHTQSPTHSPLPTPSHTHTLLQTYTSPHTFPQSPVQDQPHCNADAPTRSLPSTVQPVCPPLSLGEQAEYEGREEGTCGEEGGAALSPSRSSAHSNPSAHSCVPSSQESSPASSCKYHPPSSSPGSSIQTPLSSSNATPAQPLLPDALVSALPPLPLPQATKLLTGNTPSYPSMSPPLSHDKDTHTQLLRGLRREGAEVGEQCALAGAIDVEAGKEGGEAEMYSREGGDVCVQGTMAARIADLEEQVASLTRANSDKDNRITQLLATSQPDRPSPGGGEEEREVVEENVKLKREISLVEQICAQYDKENRDLNQENRDFREGLGRASEEKERLESQLRLQEEQQKAYKDGVETKNKQMQTLRLTAKTQELQIDELQTELMALRQDNRNLRNAAEYALDTRPRTPPHESSTPPPAPPVNERIKEEMKIKLDRATEELVNVKLQLKEKSRNHHLAVERYKDAENKIQILTDRCGNLDELNRKVCELERQVDRQRLEFETAGVNSCTRHFKTLIERTNKLIYKKVQEIQEMSSCTKQAHKFETQHRGQHNQSCNSNDAGQSLLSVSLPPSSLSTLSSHKQTLPQPPAAPLPPSPSLVKIASLTSRVRQLEGQLFTQRDHYHKLLSKAQSNKPKRPLPPQLPSSGPSSAPACSSSSVDCSSSSSPSAPSFSASSPSCSSGAFSAASPSSSATAASVRLPASAPSTLIPHSPSHRSTSSACLSKVCLWLDRALCESVSSTSEGSKFRTQLSQFQDQTAVASFLPLAVCMSIDTEGSVSDAISIYRQYSKGHNKIPLPPAPSSGKQTSAIPSTTAYRIAMCSKALVVLTAIDVAVTSLCVVLREAKWAEAATSVQSLLEYVVYVREHRMYDKSIELLATRSEDQPQGICAILQRFIVLLNSALPLLRALVESSAVTVPMSPQPTSSRKAINRQEQHKESIREEQRKELLDYVYKARNLVCDVLSVFSLSFGGGLVGLNVSGEVSGERLCEISEEVMSETVLGSLIIHDIHSPPPPATKPNTTASVGGRDEGRKGHDVEGGGVKGVEMLREVVEAVYGGGVGEEINRETSLKRHRLEVDRLSRDRPVKNGSAEELIERLFDKTGRAKTMNVEEVCERLSSCGLSSVKEFVSMWQCNLEWLCDGHVVRVEWDKVKQRVYQLMGGGGKRRQSPLEEMVVWTGDVRSWFSPDIKRDDSKECVNNKIDVGTQADKIHLTTSASNTVHTSTVTAGSNTLNPRTVTSSCNTDSHGVGGGVIEPGNRGGAEFDDRRRRDVLFPLVADNVGVSTLFDFWHAAECWFVENSGCGSFSGEAGAWSLIISLFGQNRTRGGEFSAFLGKDMMGGDVVDYSEKIVCMDDWLYVCEEVIHMRTKRERLERAWMYMGEEEKSLEECKQMKVSLRDLFALAQLTDPSLLFFEFCSTKVNYDISQGSYRHLQSLYNHLTQYLVTKQNPQLLPPPILPPNHFAALPTHVPSPATHPSTPTLPTNPPTPNFSPPIPQPPLIVYNSPPPLTYHDKPLTYHDNRGGYDGGRSSSLSPRHVPDRRGCHPSDEMTRAYQADNERLRSEIDRLTRDREVEELKRQNRSLRSKLASSPSELLEDLANNLDGMSEELRQNIEAENMMRQRVMDTQPLHAFQ
eukprot:GHVQ01032279.1.p1 GENE.GHVQ01032279.1~~GHVQ01032279.1.p1  ORF type:complete len:2378 (-),score=564.47 GHVQ01032279.1:2511-9644(-)